MGSAACGGREGSQSARPDSAGASPVDTVPLDTPSREALEAMRFTIAQRFRANPADVVPHLFERATWPDDCLGIQQDRPCRPGAIAGYRLVIRVLGKDYEYHARAADVLAFVLASGPAADSDSVALAWRFDGEDVGCGSLRIAPGGLAAIGACGGPHESHALIEEVDRLTEWRYFYERFAPFDLVQGQQTLAFEGIGKEAPTPAWKHAVLQWAGLQYGEIHGGRTGAAYGRALSAGRPIEGRPGYCYTLEATYWGRAAVSVGRCGGGAGESTQWGWIDDGSWQRLSIWLADWAPVYDAAARNGVELYAHGMKSTTEAERAELLRMVDSLIARITR
jgi:hypothetical protein